MPIKFEEYKPKTLEEAVDILHKSLDAQELVYVKVQGAEILHHSLGQAIRNEWGLWNGSELKTYFIETYKLGHADDMSGMILRGLTCKVRDEPYNAEAHAEHFQEFWLKQNIDPLTQEKVG